MSKPMHLDDGYMAHMHIQELEFLKSLKMVDGKIFYDTGVFLQPVSDRIEMYEDMIKRDPSLYKEELERLEVQKKKHEEALRNMDL